MGFLRVDRHGRDRAGDQALEADRLAGDFAQAVFALVDPAQRGIDLGDQLALAVAGAAARCPSRSRSKRGR